MPTNTQTKGTRGGRRSTTWKKGQVTNPKGAPKRGESWKEIIKDVFDKTPSELVTEIERGDLADSFRTMPPHIVMKRLVVMRVLAALMFDPQPGLLNAFMERVEGKVTQPVELDANLRKIEVKSYDYLAAVTPITVGPGEHRDTPGDGQNHRNGTALGQDHDGG